MPFTDGEKYGIVDLLKAEEQNIPICIQLGRSVTKNVIDISTSEEALECIFTHTDDCVVLLNKRAITKDVLFKYLHKKKVAVGVNFTKAILVKMIIDYWNNQDETLKETSFEVGSQIAPTITHKQQPQPTTTLHLDETEFPINLLARKFSEWFFNNYNKDTLKPHDFWQDARLLLQITANDGCDEQDCGDSTSVLDVLYEARKRFGFFFNPNLNHSGVQGRMDVHGLVLVLSCGTLHTQTDCVGVFECTFGLLRDPFSENNWKTKTIQLMLRSKGAPSIPSLEESDTLKEALALPVPQGELT